LEFSWEVFMLDRRRLLLAGAALTVTTPRAFAQDFPTRPIKIVVPLAAGGMADILARVIAAKLGEAGHTAVVENRTGGSGVIGADSVAKSAPDGYTLLMGLHATQAILVHLQKLPYDPAKDFAPVIHVATVPNVLLVNNAVPATSLKELIAYAKANPGKLTFASQGNGSTGHMIGEQFKVMAGVELTHVPYRGAAPASQDLLAGHVSMLFDIVPLAVSNLQSGKVRALAVCAAERVKVLPDVPTIAEAGLPGMEAGAWFGLFAPAGTPPAVVAWINREAQKAFAAPEARARFAGQGAMLPLETPEAFGKHVSAEAERWGALIKRAGIRME
jgi:tripartite-type tricarboxylate transporter receptor subunit TctC